MTFFGEFQQNIQRSNKSLSLLHATALFYIWAKSVVSSITSSSNGVKGYNVQSNNIKSPCGISFKSNKILTTKLHQILINKCMK